MPSVMGARRSRLLQSVSPVEQGDHGADGPPVQHLRRAVDNGSEAALAPLAQLLVPVSGHHGHETEPEEHVKDGLDRRRVADVPELIVDRDKQHRARQDRRDRKGDPLSRNKVSGKNKVAKTTMTSRNSGMSVLTLKMTKSRCRTTAALNPANSVFAPASSKDGRPSVEPVENESAK